MISERNGVGVSHSNQCKACSVKKCRTRGASRALGHVLIDERENIHVNDGEGQER